MNLLNLLNLLEYSHLLEKNGKKNSQTPRLKLTKHIGIMVQDVGGIDKAEIARIDRLNGPTILGGIVNVDRIWVGSVCIENVDGVCELTPPIRY